MKNKKLVKFASAMILTLMLTCLVAPVALADEPVVGRGQVETLDLKTVIRDVINWALGIVTLVAIIMIIYAGFLWITSEGGDNKERAQKMLTAAIIGMIITFLAYAIVSAILSGAFGFV